MLLSPVLNKNNQLSILIKPFWIVQFLILLNLLFFCNRILSKYSMFSDKTIHFLKSVFYLKFDIINFNLDIIKI